MLDRQHGNPKVGSKVEFDLENTGRGLSAINVTAIGGGLRTGSSSKGSSHYPTTNTDNNVDSKVVQSNGIKQYDGTEENENDSDDDSSSDSDSDSDSNSESSDDDSDDDDDGDDTQSQKQETSDNHGTSAPAVAPGKITGTVVYVIYFTSCLVISTFSFKLFVIRL